MGRNDQAIAEAKRAQQADPLSGFAAFSVGAALVFARRWDPAIEQLRRAIEIDPNFWFGHCFLGRAYEQKGKLPEAIVEFQRAVELEKDNAETWSDLGHAYALSGNRAEAQKILDHLREVIPLCKTQLVNRARPCLAELAWIVLSVPAWPVFKS
jgi:tetratricopeptide (TPR) repeat protein